MDLIEIGHKESYEIVEDSSVVEKSIQNGTNEIPVLQIQDALHDDVDKERLDLGRHLANMRVVALRNEEYFSSSGLSSYTTSDDDDDDCGGNRDAHLGEFAPPNEEMAQKIVKQVESMFSDSFVYRDAFMMKHIKRGAGGFVSLRLITSIRKVKSLTSDYRVVAHALSLSKELEVNEDKTKVRRVKPLPESFDSDLAQAVLVTGMPKDLTMHEKVDDVVRLVSQCLTVGSPILSALSYIPSVRIIKEVTHIPTSYKPEQSQLFTFQHGFCLLLDFYGFEKLNIFKVKDILKPYDSTGDDAWKAGLEIHQLPSIRADPSRRKNRKMKESPRQMGEMSPRIKSFPPAAKVSSSFSPLRAAPHSPSGRLETSGGSCSRLNVSSPWSSPSSSPRGSPCLKRRGKPGPSPLTGALNSSGGESPAGSPWMMRRSRGQSGSSPAGSNQSVFRNSHETKIGVTITRAPRGPDEGKGFQLVRTF